MFVSEAVVNGPDRLSRYVRPDELHTTFNFDYLKAPWDARRLREVFADRDAATARVKAATALYEGYRWSHERRRYLAVYDALLGGPVGIGQAEIRPAE